VILLGHPNDRDHDRLGIIASRRFGPAVMRTRAKRRLREVFRRQHPDGAGASGRRPLDVVAIPRREMLTLPFKAFEAEFLRALERLRAAG
jgi:ribonuclease P protein component